MSKQRLFDPKDMFTVLKFVQHNNDRSTVPLLRAIIPLRESLSSAALRGYFSE
jgi:hypothetical protein